MIKPFSPLSFVIAILVLTLQRYWGASLDTSILIEFEYCTSMSTSTRRITKVLSYNEAKATESQVIAVFRVESLSMIKDGLVRG